MNRSSIFAAAVADFKSELRDAGDRPWKRLAVRCRWYVALGTLLVVVPLTVPASPVSGQPSAKPARHGGELVGWMTVGLFAAMWSLWGWFVVGAIAAGLGFACAMRMWHDRHPTTTAGVDEFTRRPEINLSAIPVAGDVAGLMFAAGSIVLVVAGLPSLRWLFVSILIAGMACAGALLALRQRAASAGRQNSIIAR